MARCSNIPHYKKQYRYLKIIEVLIHFAASGRRSCVKCRARRQLDKPPTTMSNRAGNMKEHF